MKWWVGLIILALGVVIWNGMVGTWELEKFNSNIEWWGLIPLNICYIGGVVAGGGKRKKEK